MDGIALQGRYDVCCPMMSAWDLHKAWPEADFKVIKIVSKTMKFCRDLQFYLNEVSHETDCDRRRTFC